MVCVKEVAGVLLGGERGDPRGPWARRPAEGEDGDPCRGCPRTGLNFQYTEEPRGEERYPSALLEK